MDDFWMALSVNFFFSSSLIKCRLPFSCKLFWFGVRTWRHVSCCDIILHCHYLPLNETWIESEIHGPGCLSFIPLTVIVMLRNVKGHGHFFKGNCQKVLCQHKWFEILRLYPSSKLTRTTLLFMSYQLQDLSTVFCWTSDKILRIICC